LTVREVRNEQTKLLAAWCNNVGTGIISVGAATPLAALSLGVNTFASLETFLLVVASSILAGIGFHLFGTLFLLGYEP
jgi:hypothetical protein